MDILVEAQVAILTVLLRCLEPALFKMVVPHQTPVAQVEPEFRLVLVALEEEVLLEAVVAEVI
jgi:hypothetical protein